MHASRVLRTERQVQPWVWGPGGLWSRGLRAGTEGGRGSGTSTPGAAPRPRVRQEVSVRAGRVPWPESHVGCGSPGLVIQEGAGAASGVWRQHPRCPCTCDCFLTLQLWRVTESVCTSDPSYFQVREEAPTRPNHGGGVGVTSSLSVPRGPPAQRMEKRGLHLQVPRCTPIGPDSATTTD